MNLFRQSHRVAELTRVFAALGLSVLLSVAGCETDHDAADRSVFPLGAAPDAAGTEGTAAPLGEVESDGFSERRPPFREAPPAAGRNKPYLARGAGAMRNRSLESQEKLRDESEERSRHAADPAFTAADELWVIEAPASATRPRTGPRSDELPGSGALVARLRSAATEVPVPLERTDVKGTVSGFVATVDVVQSFRNPFDEKIEAVYVFPLPTDAAVNEFVMTIGERRIRGIVREREEARRIYDAARAQGKVASLLSQERPNIFTQSVANIEPGKKIDIRIRYFHTLNWVDGGYEVVFPMVVGPRFNPPASQGGVAALSRGAAPGVSGQSTEVTYLRPEERSGHDIALAFEIDAGVDIESIECPTHAVDARRPTPRRAVVSLGAHDRIPNRDFVLRWKVAGGAIKSSFMVERDADGEGGAFALMLYPPADLAKLERHPLELVFVLDCSGSMRGEPLARAKQAIDRALRMLQEEDTFQIISFSMSASTFGPRPIEATPRNVERGRAFVQSLQSEGGTMMIHGIRAALDFPHDPRRLRIVSFMTDGYIGNEDEIFAEVRQRLGAARIFSFGIGSSVNRHLLEGLARIGRGAVAWVGLDGSAAEEVDRFYERAARPALTDIAIDWGTLGASDVFPARVPDLFIGRPVVLTGRFSGAEPTVARIRGRAAGEEREIAVACDPAAEDAEHAGVASVWARTKIAVLTDLALAADPVERIEIADAMLEVALEHGLVSARTSFIAVDSLSRTSGDHGTTVPVPVPVPAGVRYETTVGR